jgi:hypothetical protein
MLNFESVGSPVAKIMDKTTKKEQIVYLSDPELDGEVRNGYTNIKLESHQSFQQIPDTRLMGMRATWPPQRRARLG